MSAVEVSGSAGREAGRPQPFVAWMIRPHAGWQTYDHEPNTPHSVAVVVTPLLDGDPRPGEVWLLAGERAEATIVSAPYDAPSGGATPYRRVVISEGGFRTREILVSNLRRLPVLRTFALTGLGVDWTYRVQAESREAAAKQLADMLEEVR